MSSASILSVRPSREVLDEARRRAERVVLGLYSHQVEGVAFLLGRRRAILADDMGLGKTRQSIIALREAEPEGPYLVVCPASVKRNWGREIETAIPDAAVHIIGDSPKADFRGWVIVNYDVLKKHVGALAKLPWAGVIFDEAHYLKHVVQLKTALSKGAPLPSGFAAA